MMHYTAVCQVLGLLDGPQLDHLEALEQQVVKLIDNKKMIDAANVRNLLSYDSRISTQQYKGS